LHHGREKGDGVEKALLFLLLVLLFGVADLYAKARVKDRRARGRRQ
jgi:hypothetical protein